MRKRPPAAAVPTQWIFIVTVLFRIQNVLTWTTLPGSSSRRHQVQRDILQSVSEEPPRWEPLAKLFRRSADVSSVLMMASEDGGAQSSDDAGELFVV